MKRILFLVLLFSLAACSKKEKIQYMDCVKLDDKFYGTNYGYVIEKVEDRWLSTSYKVWFGVFEPTLICKSSELTKVDDEYCKK